jgi:hypothetical protein
MQVDARAGRGLHLRREGHAATAPDLREHAAPARPAPAPALPHPVADRRGGRPHHRGPGRGRGDPLARLNGVRPRLCSRRNGVRPRLCSVGLWRLGLGQPGQRRVLGIELRGHAERLVVDLGPAVAGLRRGVGDVRVVRGDRGLVHDQPGTRSSAGAPHRCSTAGISTVPSARWPFSSSAISVRPTATAVPLRVATCRGPPSGGR